MSTQSKEKTGRKGLGERDSFAVDLTASCEVVLAPSRNVCLKDLFSEHDSMFVHLPALQCPPGTGHHSQGSCSDLAPGGKRPRREGRGPHSRIKKADVRKGTQAVTPGRGAS